MVRGWGQHTGGECSGPGLRERETEGHGSGPADVDSLECERH